MIGSGTRAHIHLPAGRGYPAEWATIRLANGKVEYEDVTTKKKQDLRNGSRLKIDTIEIEVKTV
jgi:hypothetical protein